MANGKESNKIKIAQCTICDESLLKLNEQIMKALNRYLPEIGDRKLILRFDMPDKDQLPNDPRLCVFLYDIQEDLELRHGRARSYQAHNHMLNPRVVHVRCCYLVTYWEKPSNTDIGPRSQSMRVMNAVLNALLNANLDQAMPPSFSRVIAPSEHLASLGNFWQSLGDRPRLCLNFQVTIPVALQIDEADQQVPVLSAQLEPPVAQSWEQYDKSLPFKRVLVARVLQQLSVDQMPDARAQLARLAVTCVYEKSEECPKVQVVGLLDTMLYEAVTTVIEAKENQDKWKEINVQVPVDINGLTEVKAPINS